MLWLSLRWGLPNTAPLLLLPLALLALGQL